MEEILPGVHHWSAVHPNIGMLVHSYAVGSTLIDPLLPPEGIDALPGSVSQILLTNRHHYRSSGEIVARFGCPVRCHEAGLHEFAGTDRAVEGFRWGDRLAPDIVAVEPRRDLRRGDRAPRAGGGRGAGVRRRPGRVGGAARVRARLPARR